MDQIIDFGFKVTVGIMLLVVAVGIAVVVYQRGGV